MTALDLRIEYRFATGVSPTYGKDGWGHNYRDGLTYDYARWIESQFMNKSMAWNFQRNTGQKATYVNKYGDVSYVKAYKEWLEEEFINLYNRIFNTTY